MTDSNETATLPDYVEREPVRNLVVIVVGSGIGGLTAARECWRRGFDVRVLERQPAPLLTGDSFTIGVSALGSLRSFPSLQDEVNRLGVRPGIMLHKLDGTLLKGPMMMSDLMSSQVDRDMAEKMLRLSRPKLYKAMLEHLERIGVQVEYGKRVMDYFENERSAGVVLEDGTQYEADVVVAADGANSHSQHLVQGHEVPARPSGDAVFRVAFPVEQALTDPIVAQTYHLADDGSPMMYVFNGPIQVIVSRFEDEMQWAIVHPDDGRAAESWDHNPSLESVFQLIEQYPEFPKEVINLVKKTPTQLLIDWRIMWRDPQPQWTSPQGRVVQLGDAAHTFHPSSGNGGTQAMEDAISLATCLSLTRNLEVEWATRVHNLLRFERVSCLQAFGIANQADRVKTGKLPTFGSWIMLHDPETYAVEHYDAALNHLRTGEPFQNTNVPKGMKYQPWTIDGLVAAHEKGEPTVLDGDWS